MNKRFSVSMCVYGKDNPKWFQEAVDSIWNQSVRPTEIVLVVDGPVSQELEKKIGKYEENDSFRIIRLKENQGHGAARRIGLENCQYELVALMDADDISAYDRFEKQLKEFEKDSMLDIVGGNITEFVDDPKNIVSMRKVPEKDNQIKAYMQTRCPMNQMTVMFKKQAVIDAGGYSDWYCNEDYYLWIRMHLCGKRFGNLKDVLVNVRSGKEMLKRRGGWKYFRSEWKLQKFMKEQNIIDEFTYWKNVAKRFIVQVLLPGPLRGWVFQTFARESVE